MPWVKDKYYEPNRWIILRRFSISFCCCFGCSSMISCLRFHPFTGRFKSNSCIAGCCCFSSVPTDKRAVKRTKKMMVICLHHNKLFIDHGLQLVKRKLSSISFAMSAWGFIRSISGYEELRHIFRQVVSDILGILDHQRPAVFICKDPLGLKKRIPGNCTIAGASSNPSFVVLSSCSRYFTFQDFVPVLFSVSLIVQLLVSHVWCFLKSLNYTFVPP